MTSPDPGGDPDGEAVTAAAADSARVRTMRQTILRGTSWSTLAQVAPIVVNLVMTPYIINNFGLARYGVFLLASTITTFLGSFDGGISSSVARYSAVYAGNDDRAATTRLVRSMLVVVSLVGLVLFGMLFLLAGPVLSLFHPPAELQSEGAFLLRSLSIILGLSQVRGLFAAQLSAHHLWRWISFTSLISYAVYACGIVFTIHNHLGLVGAAYTFMAQALVATIAILPRSLPFLDRHAKGFMPRIELRAFLKYAGSVQLTGLTGIFKSQADTFIVGRLLSVVAVAIYGAGASFALQLRNLPLNALGPISASLAQAYGRGGDAEAMAVFTTLQRRWVQGTAGWSAVALGASYFGVSTWLGPRFHESGVVAAILVGADAVNIWTGTLTLLLIAVGRPAVETRYSVLGVVINIGLTIPFVYAFGLLGTVSATALGNGIASLYLVRIARKHYDPHLRSFLREVPYLAVGCTVAVVVLLELLLQPLVPEGPVGLLCCGLIASPGFAVYGVLLLGPRRAWAQIQRRLPVKAER